MKTPNLFKRQKHEISFQELNAKMDYYPKPDSYIDDVTWQDLNMDDIYTDMEETLTAQGDEALYHSLHAPLFDEDAIAQRDAKVQVFKQNNLERELLRDALKKTGRLKYDFRRSILEDFDLSFSERLLYTLSPLFLLGLTAVTLYTRIWDFAIFIFFLVLLHAYLHFKFSKKYEAQIDTLSYTYKLLNFCNRFQKKELFSSYNLTEPYQKLRKTHKDISFIFQLESLDFLAEYLNILFLFKERRYSKIAKKIAPQSDILFELYEKVGQMDMHQSMAYFLKENTKPICIPTRVKDATTLLSFQGMYHPSLKKPIANDLSTTRSIVITGSNMSGKSTFLRTVGINVLLAQTWNFAYAESLNLTPLHIITSISLQDNISEGKSYFLQEADAIKRMLENANRKVRTLFLIDEIFKGTNPVERIASATEICIALADAHTLGFVATHDLQLIPQIPQYSPYYFTENVTKEDLLFDYKIRKGITSTRNAVKILEFLGYDSKLIQRINQRIALQETTEPTD